MCMSFYFGRLPASSRLLLVQPCSVFCSAFASRNSTVADSRIHQLTQK